MQQWPGVLRMLSNERCYNKIYKKSPVIMTTFVVMVT